MTTFISRSFTRKSWKKRDTRLLWPGSGAKAMELFVQENPDLVTLDILMPDVDGIKLLRQMKEKKPRLPIIMSTAYDYRDDFAVWASEAYIVKSADLDELKKTIRTLLSK